MTDRSAGLGMQERAALQRYPMEAQKLPAKGETWMRAHIDLHHGALNAFHKAGVIRKVRRNNADNDAWHWEATAGVAEWVDTHIQDPTTPCGHATGVRTITAGEEYTCSDPECDCRMDRETAEEVVA